MNRSTVTFEQIVYQLDEVIETTQQNRSRLSKIMDNFFTKKQEKESTRVIAREPKDCK